jgi:hypothetical protein
MCRGHVFVNLRKTPNGLAKDVVGLVVVYGRDFANQNITPAPPKPSNPN